MPSKPPRRDHEHRRSDVDYVAMHTGNYTDAIRVNRFAFGVSVRKNRRPEQPYTPEFSNEYEQDCMTEDCYLLFDDAEQNRYLRLKIGGHANERVQNIVIDLNNIEAIVDTGFERWTVFHLRYPPSFDTELAHPPLLPDETIDKRRHRTRYPYLCRGSERRDPIESHQRIAPFASKILYIEIEESFVEPFTMQAKKFSLPKIRSEMVNIDKHGLFSVESLGMLRKWLVTLPLALAYQCDALLWNCLLNPQELLALRPRIQQLTTDQATQTLKHFGTVLYKHINEPGLSCEKLFDTACHEINLALAKVYRRKKEQWDHFCAEIVCTPTSMHPSGPEPDLSNRVLRWYPDHWQHFVRVTLADEDMMPYRYAYEVDNTEQIYGVVILQLLQKGLFLGGRHFSYLGYSMSALRAHSFWFLNPFRQIEGDPSSEITPAVILARIGDFGALTKDGYPICYYPALYPARVAQAFSATEVSISIRRSEIIDDLPDIMANGYTFTDGVGRISPELRDEAWRALKARRGIVSSTVPPEVLQIRQAGFKGVVVTDYRLEGRQIQYRPSMKKFDAPGWDNPDSEWPLEIARSFERPMKLHLNRPMIMLMQTMGTKIGVFLEYQRRAVKAAGRSATSVEAFSSILRDHGLGHHFALVNLLNFLKYWDILDISTLSKDSSFLQGFLFRLIGIARVHVLRDLKHHARIPLPESWTLVGVADEWDELEEREIYACIQDPKWNEPIWLEGEVLVSRSPTIHPGDAQFVKAIGKPGPGSAFEKHHLPNVLVFSCKGERDLPSQLGGGDLDGDIYNIITQGNKDLFPLADHPAGQYEAVQKLRLDRPASTDDVAANIVEYIDRDIIGLVSANHLLIADRSDELLQDPKCLVLSELHSHAVDYPKTGTPVKLRDVPRALGSEKPDWNASELQDPTEKSRFYISETAVGILFRDIKLEAPPEIPQGKAIPAFQRIIDAAEERQELSPPPTWPENKTPQQRLHPSEFPALPITGGASRHVANSIQSGRGASKSSSTIKFVAHNPLPAMTSSLDAASTISGRHSITHPTSLPVGPSSRIAAPGIYSPGMSYPLGIPPPPGLSAPAGFFSEPGMPLPPGIAPPGLQASMGAYSTPSLDTNFDAAHLSDQRLRTVLKKLAASHVDVDEAPVAMSQEIQLAYGRYVIELQCISISQALAENLTEEELVVGTVMAKVPQSRRRRERTVRAKALTSRLVQELRQIFAGDPEQGSLPLESQLLRAYTGYIVAAADAVENVWGASSMCLVSLCFFCEVLEVLEGRQNPTIDATNNSLEETMLAQTVRQDSLEE